MSLICNAHTELNFVLLLNYERTYKSSCAHSCEKQTLSSKKGKQLRKEEQKHSQTKWNKLVFRAAKHAAPANKIVYIHFESGSAATDFSNSNEIAAHTHTTQREKVALNTQSIGNNNWRSLTWSSEPIYSMLSLWVMSSVLILLLFPRISFLLKIECVWVCVCVDSVSPFVTNGFSSNKIAQCTQLKFARKINHQYIAKFIWLFLFPAKTWGSIPPRPSC